MSQQQETATDRLVSIISSIQLGRRSGVLTARRGEGIASEEGTITFTNGQVTHAHVGRRSGSEALNWLSTWGNCRFTFVPAEARAPAEIPDRREASVYLGDMPTIPLLPVSPRPPGNKSADADAQVTSRSREVGPLELEQRTRTPAPLSAHVPYHIRQPEEALQWIEQNGLSRTHRHLFLLIDGQRSTLDLVRLTRRSQDEVNDLLRTLERIGVIRTNNP